MNKENTQQDTIGEEKETKVKVERFSANINSLFQLPIQYNNIISTSPSLLTDLELLETKNHSIDPIYYLLFNPKTELGKNCIQSWAKNYTNDITFLENSQKLVKKIHDIPFEKTIIENGYNDWIELKNFSSFRETFQYIEWEKILFLNKSSSCMFLLSFLNISSPLMQVLAPVLMLILPFLFIKLLGLPVTINSYIEMLKKVLKDNSMIKLITNFWSASMNQKMYIMMTVGLYFYNLYQNFLSCRQFYKNAYYIIEKMNNIKTYLDYTIHKMDLFSKKLDNLEKYNKFKEKLNEMKNRMKSLYETLNYLPKKCASFKTLTCFGNIMKDFYILYESEEWHNIMLYSFGFNGYIDNLLGIKENVMNNKLNNVTYTKRNKLKFYDLHHPAIKDNSIKNNIDLKKSIILTGPNAAGKTTMLKATIINLLFSQQVGLGFFKKCILNPYDFIHCYINIPDDCSRDSLFQSEVRRCKVFLDLIKKNPDKRHFCVFDELFSGTNPYEAISSAFSYLNHIVKNKKIRFLLTTHFIRLCKLFRKHKKIVNFNMNTTIENDKAFYTYKMIKGISETKGGISVLKDLNYPESILKDARKILSDL